jgi:hypothetical protein
MASREFLIHVLSKIYAENIFSQDKLHSAFRGKDQIKLTSIQELHCLCCELLDPKSARLEVEHLNFHVVCD